MKLGCAAWVFTEGRFLPPYEPAVDAIAEIGFEGVELIVRNEQDLVEYWTPTRVEGMRAHCERVGLEVSQFVLYQDAVAGLGSPKPSDQETAVGVVHRGIELARQLGSPVINFVSPWPVGMEGPTPYLPRSWFVNQPGMEAFDPKLRITLPPDFDWNDTWLSYVRNIKRCAKAAADAGLALALEGHTNVIVPNTDAFLRLHEHVDEPALGWNFDVAWHLIQRECLPWSVHKLGGKLHHVDARDGDGLHCYSLPPGEGIVDWHGLVEALREVGYDGFVSLEISNYADPARWARRSFEFLRDVVQA